MTRIMRDSVTVSAIPLAGTDIAAGYDDGTYKNAAGLAARFPHIPNLLIDVNGSMPQAGARDWETGDKSGSLQQWAADHNKATGKSDAVIYCNRSTITEVRSLTGSLVLGRDYWLWVATLDGTIITPAQQTGLVACQDRGSGQTGANYDESVVFADWWLPSAAGNPWPIAPGAIGSNVVILQGRLNAWGFATPPLTPDGVYGTKTLDAVRNAMTAWHYSPTQITTGIVDETLWKDLVAAPPSSPPPPPPPPPPPLARTITHLLVSYSDGSSQSLP